MFWQAIVSASIVVGSVIISKDLFSKEAFFSGGISISYGLKCVADIIKRIKK
jgi:hypothetical protein